MKTRPRICSSSRKISSIGEQVRNLLDQISIVSKDNNQKLLKKINRSRNLCEQLHQQCATLQNDIRQQNDMLRVMISQQNKSYEDLLRIKQHLEDLHYTTYDGSLTWIVDNFKTKFRKYKKKNNRIK